ncbi:MAG TPA: hypothetical protein DHV36_01490 [Desulfobacteraceae bacterium]|nr:hypothetical protein [Desulfobacteraceae bacterium]|tara:strand:- start:208 stop:1086 length:879 start_codon:yes stop_codon:yes gene_type:complete
MTLTDIRNQAHLSGEDVKKLNFIKDSDRFVFRKFYRSGLRSHIFEVVRTGEVHQESAGVVKDGIRIFPRAVPVKMFRIFRSRFTSKEDIFFEIKRYKTLLDHLGPEFIARSEEFIADYRDGGTSRLLLCGLQEYVAGEILDPWRLTGKENLRALLSSMPHESDLETRLDCAVSRIETFVKRIRSLMAASGRIPDLAGIGNLILTPEGGIKLVDINNIVKIRMNAYIPMDDKGYPACDVSIQVLHILETKLLGKDLSDSDPLFKHFLQPRRLKQVKSIEREFYRTLNNPKNAG